MRWRLFQQNAQAAGITVDFLPPVMSKHQENTSWVDLKQKVLFWRVKFTFLGASEKSASLERFDGTCSFPDEHIKFFLLFLIYLIFIGSLPLSKALEEAVSQLKLDEFVFDNSTVLFEAPFRPANDKAYYILSKDVSLNQSLYGKIVIEYPELLVIDSAKLGDEYKIIEGTADQASREGRTALETDRYKIQHNIPLIPDDEEGEGANPDEIDIDPEKVFKALGDVLDKDLK